MKTYAIRLLPSQDLKKALEIFVMEQKIKAGCIVTCVGSLKKAVLRMAGAKIVKELCGKYEIVSLVGTLCPDGLHLHMSLSDQEGNLVGGHVKDGCLVNSTAEIVIGQLEDVVFIREPDEATGYKELKVLKK